MNSMSMHLLVCQNCYNFFCLTTFAPLSTCNVYFCLEVVEHLCGLPSLMLGETLTGISKDMDLTCWRAPLGVCAGIAPFNFPAMIPLWMFPTGKCGLYYCVFSSFLLVFFLFLLISFFYKFPPVDCVQCTRLVPFVLRVQVEILKERYCY